MIVYACIARAFDAKVLAESHHPDTGGNGDQVMRALMDRLLELPEAVPQSTCKTFSQRNTETVDVFSDMLYCTGGYAFMEGDGEIDHFFHVWNHQNVYYSCISDDDDIRAHQVNFDFLRELQSDFTKHNSEARIAKAKELAFEKQWKPNIRSKLHYYNTNHTKLSRGQNIQLVLNQVEDMKSVLHENIRLVLRHQENQLDTMQRQSQSMQQDSNVFKTRAEVLLVTQRRKRGMKYCFFLIFGILTVYLILSAFCGFSFHYCQA
mmetsp:Transcript_2095/g.3079  ORF Transcript_2095/g.3079 Transcript_2095/m.3079 type:complete len:263 (+) Transcript_2095:48-836(+)